MTRAPFSPHHAFLIDMGFKLTSNEESWADDGDGESGPHVTGGPAFDEYHDDDVSLYFGETGNLVGHVEHGGAA